MKVVSVLILEGAETVRFDAVSKAAGYPEDGSDEDNTFARYTPSAHIEITVANPQLLGLHKAGQVYYVDFTPAN